MPLVLECWACRHEMEVAPTFLDGWKIVGTTIPCTACGEPNYVYVDEDSGSNYWFGLEKP